MEGNYMRPGSLVELEFITEKNIQFHWHENFELLFLISGETEIFVEEERYLLQSGDLILINTNRRHSYQGSSDLVMARFLISYNKVRELLGMDHVLFWCNSSSDRNEAYGQLRRIISGILNQSLNRERKNQLYLNSLYYQMVHILSENFVLAPSHELYREKEEKKDDRIREIFSYIRNHYRQNLSLEDIAEHLCISSNYVSKYIKQKCGINFVELINSVRLAHAVEDMMYSEDSIMKIALENGFASVSAFNKVFKEAYDKTPSEFRKEHKSRKKEQQGQADEREVQIRKQMRQYLDRHPGQHEEGKELCCLEARLDLNTDPETIWDRSSCLLINVGTAADLLNAEIRQQIVENQEQMGFRYVRFWDIYDPELYLDIHSEDGSQNFGRINAVTDFLVEHQLKPYIELGFKGRRVMRSVKKLVRGGQRDDFFHDEREMERFYRSLFINFVRRYGSWEVQQWYFEYWEKPLRSLEYGGALRYGELDETEHRIYFGQFNLIAGILREILPEAKIGGAGFPVRVYGKEAFERLLTLWKNEKEQPDFLSLSCYPYMQEKENGVYYEKRISDLNFVRYGIETASEAMQICGFGDLPIHVTEYSFSLSSRNVLNDSCMKAAYLLHNAIDCMGKAELLGQFFYTDAFADGKDTGTILFGGNGFFTKDGIPKPSYYTMEFLNQLYPAVQKKQSHYLVTKNDRGSLRFVCHNLKKPNFQYYLEEEDALSIQEIQDVLSDREYLKIRFQVSGVKSGTYVVKTNRLNNHHGSIQDKWVDMNMESELTKKEMNYLRASSISSISIRETECEGECMELEMELEPNEICYVHIYRK